MANKALVYAIYPNENRNEQEQNKSKILLDKIFRFYYNKKELMIFAATVLKIHAPNQLAAFFYVSGSPLDSFF